ncbi:hypothetical protein K2Y00_02995 [Patescibacteria group bacterium]|nr:hypothetical protein [Patescibacteria group bacterium]
MNEALAAAAAASTLAGSTEQPWPPTEELTAHDIERLVHWAEGEDADGRPYGEYLGVRTRILDAWARRESITPILHQLKEAHAEINPFVMSEHLLDILMTYEHGTRLTAGDRQIITEIVTTWPVRFEVSGSERTRLGLVDAMIAVAPIMEELLITETVLTAEELALWHRA